MKTRLSVYDFDGTLMDTPLPDVGKEIWREKTGEEYPHVGWWGRPESLSLDVFEINPFPSVLNSLKNDMTRSDTYTVILTSRLERLRPQIEGILQTHDITADEILLKNDGKEKNQRVEALLEKLPDVTEVNLYDDREKEFRVFRKFKEDNPDLQVNIYKADEGKVSLIEGAIYGESPIVKIIEEELERVKNQKS